MSIRLRLTLWYTSFLAVALIFFGVIVYNIVYHNTLKDLQGRLVEVAKQVEAANPVSPEEVNLDSSAPGFNTALIGIQLVDYTLPEGRVRGKSSNMIASNLTFPYPSLREANKSFIKTTVIKDTHEVLPFYIHELPLILKGTQKVVGLLQVGSLIQSETLLFTQLKSILWLIGLFGVISAFFLGLFLSRKALRPINRVTEAAEQIQSGSELGLRIPREVPNDEIGRLTDTLNNMLERLKRAYNELEETNIAQRRFVSDASHELRTPLTTIRGNMDLLEKMLKYNSTRKENLEEEWEKLISDQENREIIFESMRDIAAEARRMSILVNDLLALARVDAGYKMEISPLFVAPILEEVARRASFLPHQAEWIFDPIEDLQSVQVMGNKNYLQQLLFILIENGFKYTPEGYVRLSATCSGKHLGLTVEDTGIGMPADQVPFIFERFYRIDLSRGQTHGTGLGLAIAKWITDKHHGKLEVRTTLGKGSAFTLWLTVLS